MTKGMTLRFLVWVHEWMVVPSMELSSTEKADLMQELNDELGFIF